MISMELKLCRKNGMRGGAALALIALCVSCSKEEPVAEEVPPVLVQLKNGFEITLNDLDVEMIRIRESGASVPSETELLDRMIQFHAQVQKASFQGLENDPEVRRRLDKVLLRALRKKEMGVLDTKVSDEELRQVYESEVINYTKPATDRLAMLVLKVGKSATSEKREGIISRMEEAKMRAEQQPARKGRGPSLQGFSQLSLSHSDDQISRYRGGDIGWSSRTQPSARVPEAVWRVGIDLEKGAVSDVIETDGAFYLIKKTDTRPETVTPLEKVTSSIRMQIIEDRRKKLEANYLDACEKWAAPKKNKKNTGDLSSEVKTPSVGNEKKAPVMNLM